MRRRAGQKLDTRDVREGEGDSLSGACYTLYLYFYMPKIFEVFGSFKDPFYSLEESSRVKRVQVHYTAINTPALLSRRPPVACAQRKAEE